MPSVPLNLALIGAGLFPRMKESADPRESPASAGLGGNGSGDGAVASTHGKMERLARGSTEAMGGDGFNPYTAPRQASDRYDFDLRVSFADAAGAIIRKGNEAANELGSGISGRDCHGVIDGTLERRTFPTAVTFATQGNRRSVNRAARSGDAQRSTITLRRAG